MNISTTPRFGAILAIILVVIGLAACGGGSDATTTSLTPAASWTNPVIPTAQGNEAAMKFAASAMPTALRAAIGPYNGVTPVDAAEQGLNWAQQTFPQFFPGHKTTQSFECYRYRFYPETGTYVGIAINVAGKCGDVKEGGAYVMGGVFGNSPVYQGQLADYMTPSPGFQGHGYYANPAEPGSSFFFEAQGATAMATFYLYETDGRAVWYSAIGAFTDDGGGKYRFSGVLQRFTGGQPLGSVVVKAPRATAIGSVSIEFVGERAQVSLAGRSFAAEKVHKAGVGAPASAKQPETGMYWDPSESGRGHTIETRGNIATIGVFHYAADGQPTWNRAEATLPANGTTSWIVSELMAYKGGQALTGAYKAPTTSVAGNVVVSFDDACFGYLYFGDVGNVIKRLGFANQSGAACRSASSVPEAIWPGTVPTAGTYQYEWWDVGYTKSLRDRLVSKAARGFLPQGRSLYVRYSDETFAADLQFNPQTVPDAQVQFLAMSTKGYRWIGTFGNSETDTSAGQAWAKGTSGRLYSYKVEKEPASTLDYLAIANALGAQGYRHAGTVTNYVSFTSFLVFEKLVGGGSLYAYEGVIPPATRADMLSLVNSRGSQGWRWMKRTFLPRQGSYQYDDFDVFERDTTQATNFSYSIEPYTHSALDVFVRANTLGAQGWILFDAPNPFRETIPAGQPSTALYYRETNCAGLCEPRRQWRGALY